MKNAKIHSKNGIKFSPINPGPLPKEISSTFSGGCYKKKVLKNDTVMYRVYGGKAQKVGRFFSLTPQLGNLQSQIDLALNPEWGNTAEHVTKVIIPKGTIIFEGKAELQFMQYNSGYLLGGGNQIYIQNIKTDWFK